MLLGLFSASRVKYSCLVRLCPYIINGNHDLCGSYLETVLKMQLKNEGELEILL